MKKEKREHALAIIKAGLAAIPVVGGSLSSLIGDYIPSSTQKSIEYVINELRERIEKLESRIDIEHVNKDEFSELFKASYIVAIRTSQKKKLDAVAALMANILLRDNDPAKLAYTEIDHFIRCIENLSIGAIDILGTVYSIAEARNKKPGAVTPTDLNFKDIAEVAAIEPSLLMGLIGELNSVNLLHLPGAPTIRTENYSNYLVQLTPLGINFMKFILKNNEVRSYS